MKSLVLLCGLFVSVLLALGDAQFPPYNCNNYVCLPGIEVLGMGWDAVYGQTRSQQVVDYSYDQGQITRNPYNLSTTYLVPDQMTVANNPIVQQAAETSVAYSVSQRACQAKGSVDFGIDVDWGVGSLKESATVSAAASYLAARDQFSSYAQTSMVISLYQASLLLPSQLNFTRSFVQAVRDLPAVYEPNAYSMFIADYGTHYLEGAFFGGSGVLQVGINTQYAQTKSSADISVQAGIQFDWFKAGGSGQQSDSWFQGNKTQSSRLTSYFVGGDPTIQKNLTDWTAWEKSFFNFPAALFTSPTTFPFAVVPLYHIIADPVISANMKKAVQYYINNNPYPKNPPCMQQVYCGNPDSYVCCDQASPVCCANGKCAADQESCGGKFDITVMVNGLCTTMQPQVCKTSVPAYTLACAPSTAQGMAVLPSVVTCGQDRVCTFAVNSTDTCKFRADDPLIPACSIWPNLLCWYNATATAAAQ